MFEYVSGLIFKNRIVLAPPYNPTHCLLLREMNIEDNYLNASKMFVRAKLFPNNQKLDMPVDKWQYKICQDVVPDWFKIDKSYYEYLFREEVSNYVKENIIIIADKIWTPIKKCDNKTYYLLNGIIKMSCFSDINNDYRNSIIRTKLLESELFLNLKNSVGNKMISIENNLISMDGLHNYGILKNDLISILNLDLYRECRIKIPRIEYTYWLSTPSSTLSCNGDSDTVCIRSTGFVDYRNYSWELGIRPYFILSENNS